MVVLKGMAAKNKQPSPEFRDLGETEKSTPSMREYAVECRCMGQAATATAQSKQQARALAAEKVINILSPKKENTPKKRVYKRKNKA